MASSSKEDPSFQVLVRAPRSTSAGCDTRRCPERHPMCSLRGQDPCSGPMLLARLAKCHEAASVRATADRHYRTWGVHARSAHHDDRGGQPNSEHVVELQPFSWNTLPASPKMAISRPEKISYRYSAFTELSSWKRKGRKPRRSSTAKGRLHMERIRLASFRKVRSECPRRAVTRLALKSGIYLLSLQTQASECMPPRDPCLR
jgi:hypothetical protein